MHADELPVGTSAAAGCSVPAVTVCACRGAYADWTTGTIDVIALLQIACWRLPCQASGLTGKFNVLHHIHVPCAHTIYNRLATLTVACVPQCHTACLEAMSTVHGVGLWLCVAFRLDGHNQGTCKQAGALVTPQPVHFGRDWVAMLFVLRPAAASPLQVAAKLQSGLLCRSAPACTGHQICIA
jgi:hypothetical protein